MRPAPGVGVEGLWVPRSVLQMAVQRLGPSSSHSHLWSHPQKGLSTSQGALLSGDPGAPASSLRLTGHWPSLRTAVPPLEQPVPPAPTQPIGQALCAGELPSRLETRTQTRAPPRRGLTLSHPLQTPLWPHHLHPQPHLLLSLAFKALQGGPLSQGSPDSRSHPQPWHVLFPQTRAPAVV